MTENGNPLFEIISKLCTYKKLKKINYYNKVYFGITTFLINCLHFNENTSVNES